MASFQASAAMVEITLDATQHTTITPNDKILVNRAPGHADHRGRHQRAVNRCAHKGSMIYGARIVLYVAN